MKLMSHFDEYRPHDPIPETVVPSDFRRISVGITPTMILNGDGNLYGEEFSPDQLLTLAENYSKLVVEIRDSLEFIDQSNVEILQTEINNRYESFVNEKTGIFQIYSEASHKLDREALSDFMQRQIGRYVQEYHRLDQMMNPKDDEIVSISQEKLLLARLHIGRIIKSTIESPWFNRITSPMTRVKTVGSKFSIVLLLKAEREYLSK